MSHSSVMTNEHLSQLQKLLPGEWVRYGNGFAIHSTSMYADSFSSGPLGSESYFQLRIGNMAIGRGPSLKDAALDLEDGARQALATRSRECKVLSDTLAAIRTRASPYLPRKPAGTEVVIQFRRAGTRRGKVLRYRYGTLVVMTEGGTTVKADVSVDGRLGFSCEGAVVRLADE